MVPVTSLLFSSRLINRFGAANVIIAGIVTFACGLMTWAIFFGSEPNVALAVIGIMLTGVGVGLTFPTVMGAGTSALPPSSFAAGSGVINMIRQAAFAVGVAILIAIIGRPGNHAAQIAAFHFAWWVLAGITLISIIPALAMAKRA
jgi:MFS family permease